MLKFALLLFVFVLLLYPCANAQESPRITVNLENVTLREFFSYIEKKYSYDFTYNNVEINDKQIVSVKSLDKTISEILTLVLEGKGIEFRIQGAHIALSKKTKEIKNQQERTITGIVSDADGVPIIGAMVVDPQSGKMVRTGIKGDFSIEVGSDDAKLKISYFGFTDQEISTAGQSSLYAVLRENAKALEEVVVIGYGTVRRRDLTGSVSSLKGSVIGDVPVTSTAQAIAGRVAGVVITSADGSQDADIKIRVRGGGSITQDNSPLYLVDGFPVDNLNDIPPNDIASIDVLKDASSTAIYGARGANGVILITTKEGSSFEGKSMVRYNGYVGIKKVTKTFDVLNPYEYVLWQYEISNLYRWDWYERYYGVIGDIDLYKQMNAKDWQKEVFGQVGSSSVHNLSFSGNGKATRYNISFTRSDEKEIMLGAGSAKTNLNARSTHKINNWLTMSLNVTFSDNLRKGAGTTTNTRLPNIIMYKPIEGLSNYVDPDLVNLEDFDVTASYNKNPVLMTEDDYRRYHSIYFRFNAAADVKLNKRLTYRLEYGNSHIRSTNQVFYGLNTPNVASYGEMPMATITHGSSKSFRLVNTLTYRKKDIHPGGNLTVMAGQELVSSQSGSTQASVKYLPKYISAKNALSMMQLGVPDPIRTTNNPDNKLSSFFGRLSYDLMNRYLLTATIRVDGSSKFARGNRWGYFPSAALAWRVNEESFMESTRKWLDELKLRVSYGLSGNNRISDNAWRKTYSVQTGSLFVSDNETNPETPSPTPYVLTTGILDNPELKWETTASFNVGWDFGLFKRRLTGSIDLYKNTTRDLLISATIPAQTGYSKQWQNIGQTSNRGIELTLNGMLVSGKDLQVSASFNISFNRGRIDKLGEAKQWEQISMWYGWVGTGTVSGDYLVKEGAPIGQMYGYVTDGMYTFDDFDYDPAAAKYILKPGVPSNQQVISASRYGPGAVKFKDLNGDGVVNTDDKTVIGDANPKHTGGFNVSLRYKGFDLTAFFNWVYGNDIYNATKIFTTAISMGYPHRNMLDIMNSDNRFTYVDKTTGEFVFNNPERLAEINRNATIWSSDMSNLRFHSWAVEDGSFLRLNTLTIGYSLPKKVLKRWKMNTIRVYASAFNFYTWTHYSGYDPEVDVVRRTPLTPGVDWSACPRARSFNIGVNIEF